MAKATFTEGQKYLVCWAASSPTRMLYTGASVPVSAPSDVCMTALRGLERRGFFRESGNSFFALTESGLRVAASWADDVERQLRDCGAAPAAIRAWREEAGRLSPGSAPAIARRPRRPRRSATMAPMSPRGGARKGAGRPPVADPLVTVGYRFPRTLLTRMDAVLDPGEDRSAFTRAAVEAAIAERERLR